MGLLGYVCRSLSSPGEFRAAGSVLDSAYRRGCTYSTLHHSFDPTGPPAFVFDIDGVLIRGKNVIPAAVEAMQLLCPGGRWRSPVCFMTNGGGVTEAQKALQLSSWLEVPVEEQQVILSHTPMRCLAPRLAEQPVLVAGRGDVAHVAATYGFRQVVTTDQLAAALPFALPFRPHGPLPCPGSSATPPPPPPAATTAAAGWPNSEAMPLAAVLVMADPYDWYQDLQLLADVITGHGLPTRGQPQAGSTPIEVYFSNPDLLWANEYCRPRFGQGAFATALDSLHRQLTGSPLPNTRWFGKPNPEPYRLAEQLLAAQARGVGLMESSLPSGAASAAAAPPTSAAAAATWRQNLAGQGGVAAGQSKVPGSSTPHGPQTRDHTTAVAVAAAHPWDISLEVLSSREPSSAAASFSGIYAVGDNPAADVRGANQAGGPWVSVLVRTGVFQGPGRNSASDPAHIVVTDVLAAVQAALHRTRSSRWHSMR